MHLFPRLSTRVSCTVIAVFAALLNAVTAAGVPADGTKTMAEAAGEVNRLMRARLDAGERLTAEVATLNLVWARRQARWEVAAAADARARGAALTRYADRVKALRDGFQRENRPDAPTAERLDEARREAEGLLRRAGEANVAIGPDPRIDEAVEPPAPPDAPQAKPGDAEATAAGEARAETGRLLHRLRTLEPVSPAFVERICQSSRRLWVAQSAAEPTKFDRVQAAREHLSRMKSFHQRLDTISKAEIEEVPLQLAQVAYFVREAELWLAEAR